MDAKPVLQRWSTAGRAVAAACLVAAMAGCASMSETGGGAAAASDAAPDAAPMSALGAYLAARHGQQVRDYAHAAEYMSHALAEDPSNFDLLRRTFVLRVSEGRVADAVPLAQRIVQLDQAAGLAQLVLMLQEVKAGDFVAATARARALPTEGAQRLAAPLLLAWCELGAQHPAPALRALDGLDEVHGVQMLKDLHAALIADEADRLDDADQAFKRAIGDQQRLTWRTVELAGNFYERHERSEEARRLYERLGTGDQNGEITGEALRRIAAGKVPPRIITTPRDGIAEALFDLASVLDQHDTLDASLVYARLALDLRPAFPLAQLLVAEIDEDQRHTADALAEYRAIDPQSPLGWAARLRAAIALDALNRTDEAAAELNRMAAERPQDPEPLVELGDLLRARNRFTDAVGAYDAAIARIPATEPRQWRLYYSRGAALERSGQWARAEGDLKRALELQPDQPLVLNYLGYSWIDRGEHLAEGLNMVKRAVELRPDDGYIVDSLGWAYYRLGEFGNATRQLEKAIELLPEDPTINDHLGDAYWQEGRVVEARYQWRRALQFKPEADQVRTIESKLDRGIAKLPAAAATRGG
jgi:tetratricopeptide (TPR) repeat protein